MRDGKVKTNILISPPKSITPDTINMHFSRSWVHGVFASCTFFAATVRSTGLPPHVDSISGRNVANSTASAELVSVDGRRPTTRWPSVLDLGMLKIPNSDFVLLPVLIIHIDTDLNEWIHFIQNFATQLEHSHPPPALAPYRAGDREIHPESASIWRIRLYKRTMFRARVPVAVILNAIKLLVGLTRRYGPAELGVRIGPPGVMVSILPSYELFFDYDLMSSRSLGFQARANETRLVET